MARSKHHLFHFIMARFFYKKKISAELLTKIWVTCVKLKSTHCAIFLKLYFFILYYTVIVDLFVECNLQVSFDDVCHMDSVITRVTMSEFEPEKFAVSRQHIKQTKKLLRESLAAERGEEDMPEEGAIKHNNNKNETICLIES